MKRILMISVLTFCINLLFAQDFITKGTIEYEVKTNVYKTMGTGMWADAMKENTDKFKTGYYDLVFDGSKSYYSFNHWDANTKIPSYLKKNDEENKWFFDHATNEYSMQKQVYGSTFTVKDSVPNIKWKLDNEVRIIAGYTCRKATGVILDSVYIFAFYTDEIVTPAGPSSISGLPGIILGLTIPRLYSSWIATKVTPGIANISVLKPATAKKTYSRVELLTALKDRTSDWGSSNDEEGVNYVAQIIWNALL